MLKKIFLKVLFLHKNNQEVTKIISPVKRQKNLHSFAILLNGKQDKTPYKILISVSAAYIGFPVLCLHISKW